MSWGMERWVFVAMAAVMGAGSLVLAGSMPVEGLLGMALLGWTLVLGVRFGVADEGWAVALRLGIYGVGVCVGVAVAMVFWSMLWAAVLDAGWKAVLEVPAVVVAVDSQLEGPRRLTPWLGVALGLYAGRWLLDAIAVAVVAMVTGLGGGMQAPRGAWGRSAARLRRVGVRMRVRTQSAMGAMGAGVGRWMFPVTVVGAGAAGWVFAPAMPVEGLLGMVLAGWAVVLSVWFAVPEERSTVGVRLSVYVAGGCVGVGVVMVFWSAWAQYLPASGWGVALAFPGAVVRVNAGLEGVRTLTPWIGAALGFFGWFFAIAVSTTAVFGMGGVEHGRKRSQSELFGKSRFMARRKLREMTAHGGVVLGVMDKGGNGALVGYPLEGAIVTAAPPRTGKTALIAANLLAPGRLGFVKGSTVIMDPRGELFFVAAERRQAMGRNVVLADPFGLVEELKAEFKGRVRVPKVESVRFNPLDFVRTSDYAVADIRALLDGLLTPPARQAADNSRHFYDSARAVISGVVGYVLWMGRKHKAGALAFEHVRRWVTPTKSEERLMRQAVDADAKVGFGLTKDSLDRMDRVGRAEGGSTFSTIANQLDWLQVPELRAATESSTFDPMTLAEGNTDLFLVVPESRLEVSKAWIRLWVVAANAVAERKLDHAGIVIVLDEAPRLGFLKPVMDSFYLAAGKGVRYWFFTQAKSAADAVYQRENMAIIFDLAEVLQVLEFPRANVEFAESISKAIGHTTFVNTSRNEVGVADGDEVLRREQSVQSGVNRALVKERLMSPEDLMMLDVDEQIVLTNSKVVGREAIKMFLVRYWERADMRKLAGPNPYWLRKEVEGAV